MIIFICILIQLSVFCFINIYIKRRIIYREDLKHELIIQDTDNQNSVKLPDLTKILQKVDHEKVSRLTRDVDEKMTELNC